MVPTEVGSFDSAGFGDDKDVQSEASEVRSFGKSMDDLRQAPDVVFLDESRCRGEYCKRSGVWRCRGHKLGSCRTHAKMVRAGTQDPIGYYEPITTGRHTDVTFSTLSSLRSTGDNRRRSVSVVL